MSVVLEVTGLSKTFRLAGGEQLRAVREVDLVLERGAAAGIVGESGSGKSTLARLVVGLEQPTAGRIVVDGHDRTNPPRNHRERVTRARELQIVFQDPYTSLDSRQSASACIEEVLALHRRDGHGRVSAADLLTMVGLPERTFTLSPRRLSGGQRQRIAIARALATRPQVLILDEAVSALDVSVQAQILNLLEDLRQQTGTALLFISHDLGVIRQITDTAVVMRHGVVVERGRVEQLLVHPEHPYTRALVESIPGPDWRPTRFDRSSFDAPPVPAASPTPKG